MNVSDLTERELVAVRKTMEFWVANWDWECPTLFGLKRDELSGVITAWPGCDGVDSHVCALAVIGSLRELLLGASAVKPERVARICGLAHDELRQLLSAISERFRNE